MEKEEKEEVCVDKQKNKKALSIFMNFIFWLLIIIYLELIYKLSMGIEFDIESIINVTLYSIMLSAFFSVVSRIFNNKANNCITAICLFILGILFSVQCVFTKIFTTNFSLSNLALGDQAAGFIGEAFKGIFTNIAYIIAFLLPFILYFPLKKNLKFKRNTLSNYIIYSSIFVTALILFLTHMYVTKENVNSTYKLYYKINEVSINIEKLGVLNSYRLDFIREVFGFEQAIENEGSINPSDEGTNTEEEPIVYEYNLAELDFEKSTSNKTIKQINEYIKNDQGTQKNEYTGMFKDYNLIYITAESFYEIGISEELTPTLYKMTHSGFVFDNFYSPTVLSTIGGEFQSLTGLYPDSSILSTWRSGKNYFPYGLATVFSDLGYSTYAYHDHSYTFQDRNKYIKTQGFTNYLAKGNGLQKRMNCNMWPESDDEMMRVTVTDYIEDETPFLAYYMTVSGHMGYNWRKCYECKAQKRSTRFRRISRSQSICCNSNRA